MSKIKYNTFKGFTGQFVYRDKGGFMETLAEKKSKELQEESDKCELTIEVIDKLLNDII
jgi:hypothetical protein